MPTVLKLAKRPQQGREDFKRVSFTVYEWTAFVKE